MGSRNQQTAVRHLQQAAALVTEEGRPERNRPQGSNLGADADSQPLESAPSIMAEARWAPTELRRRRGNQ